MDCNNNKQSAKKILLILGEGNFSFTYSIIKKELYPDYYIFATDITNEILNNSTLFFLEELKQSPVYNKRLFIDFGIDAKYISFEWEFLFKKYFPNEPVRSPNIIQFNCPFYYFSSTTKNTAENTSQLVYEIFRNANEMLEKDGKLKMGFVKKDDYYYKEYQLEKCMDKFPKLIHQQDIPNFHSLYEHYEHVSNIESSIPGIENNVEHTFTKME